MIDIAQEMAEDQRYIEKSLSRATRAAHRLMRDGFSVERVELGDGGRPRIEISYRAQCSLLGDASRFSLNPDGRARCRVEYEGCQVSWCC